MDNILNLSCRKISKEANLSGIQNRKRLGNLFRQKKLPSFFFLDSPIIWITIQIQGMTIQLEY